MASPAQIFASAQSTADLVKNAMKAAATTKGLKLKKAIPVDQLLLALLEHAVGDKGQRHTASVVLAAGGDTKALVEAARVWMEEMIFPCECLHTSSIRIAIETEQSRLQRCTGAMVCRATKRLVGMMVVVPLASGDHYQPMRRRCIA